MVAFDQARKMGEEAGTGAVSQFESTIKNMKRLVGLAFDDPRAQREMKLVPFQCVPMKHGLGGPDSVAVKVSMDGEDKVIPVEAVCGMIVHHMGMIVANKAVETSGNTSMDPAQFFPQDWVIAIPSYYTDAQRRALLSGCEIVGIPSIQRLMHENTAVALAYGIFKDIRKEFEKEKPTNVMFIDLGASCYTVTVAAFEPGKLTIKSSYYDADLGGRCFDETIADWIANKFVEKYSKKLSSKPQDKPKVMVKVLAAAEKAKKTLSPTGVKEASINLECLMEDLDFSIMLKADEYEAMCAPLLARLEAPLKKALAEAGLTSNDLSSVELVGGSTRIGFVKTKLLQILGVPVLSTTMNADEAVARGAALQSAILSPRFKVLPYEIVEHQPLPVTLAWDEDKSQAPEVAADGTSADTNSVVMFPRGLNFPIVRRVTLKRKGEFRVYASYDKTAGNFGFEVGSTESIATWSIKGPADSEQKVRVNVKADIHGIVQMSTAQMVEDIEGETKDEETNEGDDKKKKVKKTNLEVTVTKPLDWSKDEINKFHEMEVAMANKDRVLRETADMRNELESYIYGMRDKLVSESQLGNFGTDAEKEAFARKNEDMENWLYEDGFDATKSVYAAKLQELKVLGGPIEARALEAAGRPEAVDALQKHVEKFKTWLAEAQGNENYSHITEEEFNKCHTKCDETSGWVYEMMDKQGALPANVNPAFTVADCRTKSVELTNVCGPIMHKPKPKPPPQVDLPKKDEKSAEPPSDGDPMETEESPPGSGDNMETEESK
jgi:heat shock 70kDa protein 4